MHSMPIWAIGHINIPGQLKSCILRPCLKKYFDTKKNKKVGRKTVNGLVVGKVFD